MPQIQAVSLPQTLNLHRDRFLGIVKDLGKLLNFSVIIRIGFIIEENIRLQGRSITNGMCINCSRVLFLFVTTINALMKVNLVG